MFIRGSSSFESHRASWASIFARVQALRAIAHKIIRFIAQIEDFQKKLWLKKQFVTACDYVVTLDRIPEELYPAIAACHAQREEWVRLMAIDELKGDLGRTGYSVPLTVEFFEGEPVPAGRYAVVGVGNEKGYQKLGTCRMFRRDSCVEAEQGGKARAEYGAGILKDLAMRPTERFGRGYSAANLANLRDFFPTFRERGPAIFHTVCREFPAGSIFYPVGRKSLPGTIPPTPDIGSAPGDAGEHTGQIFCPAGGKLEARQDAAAIRYPADSELAATEPPFHPNLGWSHYRALMRVQKLLAREFYESECIEARWTKRELERQIGSLYYERLLMSKSRKKMILENRKGAVSAHAAAALEVIKDPSVLEFLGLPEDHTLNETDLETRLVNQLQTFLMELGRGFAFIGRQHRLTLEGDHF